MPEGLDQAASAFATELSPQAPPQPRDEAGRFAQVQERPEPMFRVRELEGDPLTGDTRDAGDDPRLRAREQEIADGRNDERQRDGRRNDEGRRAQDAQDLRRSSADDRYDVQEGPRDRVFDVDESEQYDLDGEGADVDVNAEAARGDSERSSERDAEAPKYEVMVDGQPHEVTLEEALRGYVRQATFHQRNTELLNVRQEVENEAGRLSQNWKLWDKAKRDYEEDLASMIPREPDWDTEFARNPQGAHTQQKIFAALYQKLAQSQQQRAEREAMERQEEDRRVQKYAVEGFSRFVMNAKIPDEATLKKEINSMRRTAADAGFSPYEVATVYDPRMLIVLQWASKYRRMMAARPRAIAAEQGRTLPPGAATPFGNVRRAGFDDAQRRLASTGRLEDAAEVFRRIL